MGCLPYQTTEDARRSLNGAIVLYAGVPKFVRDVYGPDGVVGPGSDPILLNLRSMNGRDPLEVMLNDHNLDVLRGMRLGYMNIRGHAIYLRRLAANTTTQGLSTNNVTWRTIKDPNDPYGDNTPFTWRQVTEDEGFIKMFLQEYPTMDDFVKNPSWTSMAFSRNFAISRDKFRGDLIIYYKGDPCGWGDMGTPIKLGPDHQHLREQIKELGINVQ